MDRHVSLFNSIAPGYRRFYRSQQRMFRPIVARAHTLLGARPDASFDFVISSFVAQGLPAALRARLYREAGRIARQAVVIHDYRGRQGIVTELAERLEGGDYFSFHASGEAELRAAFPGLEIVDVGGSKAWYIGRRPSQARLYSVP